jgi:hypothetical protein
VVSPFDQIYALNPDAALNISELLLHTEIVPPLGVILDVRSGFEGILEMFAITSVRVLSHPSLIATK